MQMKKKRKKNLQLSKKQPLATFVIIRVRRDYDLGKKSKTHTKMIKGLPERVAMQ